jgi:hypothetical protein
MKNCIESDNGKTLVDECNNIIGYCITYIKEMNNCGASPAVSKISP